MATNNPYTQEAGTAAQLLFDNLERQEQIPDQITQLGNDINAFDTTGDVRVTDLLTANDIVNSLKQDLNNEQTALNLEIDTAKYTTKQYFLADPSATGIVNKEGTKKVTYDSGTDTVSIVPYP